MFQIHQTLMNVHSWVYLFGMPVLLHMACLCQSGVVENYGCNANSYTQCQTPNAYVSATCFEGYFGDGTPWWTIKQCSSCPVCLSTEYILGCPSKSGEFWNNPTCNQCSSRYCQAGSYYSSACGGASLGGCVYCSSGTYTASLQYMTTVATACPSCPIGTYQPSSGSTGCINCGAGKYQPNIKKTLATDCISCPVGTYSGELATSACTSCGPGMYSAVTGATSSTVCAKCEAGKFAATASGLCSSCALGSYANGQGFTACVKCPDGSPPASSTASSCTPCAAGYYSQGGNTCTYCGSGTYAPSSGMSACLSCLAGATCTATFFTCAPGTYLTTGPPALCNQCPAGLYTQCMLEDLIVQPL